MAVAGSKELAKKNWRLSARFLQILEALSDFDTADHKWAIEIGDFDNYSEKFVASNEDMQNETSSEDWPRIARERELYLELVKVRPVPFTDFESTEQLMAPEREQILKQAARMSFFDFTEKEICELLNLNSNYLKINRSEFKKWKAVYMKQHG